MSTTDVNFNYSMVTSEDPYATLQGGNSFDILTSYGEHSFSYGYEEGDFIYMFGSNSYTDAGPDNDFIVAYSDDDTVVTGTGSDTINTANLAGSAVPDVSLSSSIFHVSKLTLADLTSEDALILVQEGITGRRRNFSLSEQDNAYVMTDSENNLTLVFTNKENAADLLNARVMDCYYTFDNDNYNYDYYTTTIGGLLNIPGSAPSDYNYHGYGNVSLSNFEDGGSITWDCSFNGIGVNGDEFSLYSSSGSLSIQNSRNKLVKVKTPHGEISGYAYMSSIEGTIDGRPYNDAVEVIVGADDKSNIIIAGGSGSSLWGGSGNAPDTLVGSESADTFFYGAGDGDDVIQSTNGWDSVKFYTPLDFTEIYTKDNSLVIRTSTGTLSVTNWGTSSVNNFQLADGSTYTLSEYRGTVTAKLIS
ncbi:MAG: hypothetical protein IKR28_07210 [Selenomonadaceae bacterium]|nr:hypothetical protein [Selenomonadaceae bacterium]